MRLLLILLVSFNCLADTKVEINRTNGMKYEATFKTLAEADAWIADNEANNSFGIKANGEYAVVKTDVTTEVAAKKSKADKIALGKLARKKCEQSLDLIAGYNLTSGKTSAEIDAMIIEFADAYAALKNFRPDTAKTIINGISNPLYVDLKADLLSVLN